MYQEGEFFVLQTYPLSRNIPTVKRTFDYREAKSYCELENMAHDYSHYALRLYQQGRLWTVNHDGTAYQVSQEQF